MKVLEESVVKEYPAISTAWSCKLCLNINSSDTIIAAPAPSDVGQHYNLVKGPWTAGDLEIYSMVYLSLN